MNYELVVRQDFGPYKKGDVISDPADVAKYNDHSHVVRRVAQGKPSMPAQPPAQ